MSLMIDNTDDLLRVLKKLGIKVTGVEELKGLLASINAHYNPDAARMKVAKLIGVAVPVVALVVAGLISFFLVFLTASPTAQRMTHHTWVAVFAVLWGVAGVVGLGALGVSLFFLLGSRRTAAALTPPARGESPALTAITGQLAGHAGQHDL